MRYRYNSHVTQISSAVAPTSRHRLALPARLAILGTLFFADKIFLNTFVDFELAQSATGLGAILRVGQHWGFRFFVAFAAAVALFAYVRGGQNLKTIAVSIQATPIRLRWIAGHVLFIAILAPLSYLLYRYTATELSFAIVLALWVILGVAAAIAASLGMAPRSMWLAGARALGVIWWYAAIAALFGTGVMQLAQSLWSPTAKLTFDLVRLILTPVLPTLIADPTSLVLSTDHFSVQIADVCSGLEGVGLVLAFCSAWLLYFRREYIFPRALLLIPIGSGVIFGLNVLRIAVLILIGDAGFPNVAVYGFHSQAGWIAFITVACGLVYWSRRSLWLTRTAVVSATDNPVATYLMPLLAILAAGVLSRAMSGGFESFYALRLIAGIAILARYRRRLAAIDWRWSWRGPTVGLLVFLIWILAAHFLTLKAAMPEGLSAFSPVLRGFWIVCRCTASVLVVPIAEEIAYRGYLMRRLVNPDFESVPYRSVGWAALTVTAIIFGLAHAVMWLPGIAAGMAFGILAIRRNSIGEAVAAHVTANALVATTVLGWSQWQLW